MLLLTEIIKTSPEFLEMPLEKKEIFARLATEFEDNDLALFLTPVELTDKLNLGNKFLWQEFLNLDCVKIYIKQQQTFNAQIASRKSLSTLAKAAERGDVQAAKQVNDIAGLHNRADDNKIVILHQIQRPQLKEPTNA